MSLDLLNIPEFDLDFDFTREVDEMDSTMIGSDHLADKNHARVQVPSTGSYIIEGKEGEDELTLDHMQVDESSAPDPESSSSRLNLDSQVQVDIPPPDRNGVHIHAQNASLQAVYHESSTSNSLNAPSHYQTSTSTVCHNGPALPSQSPPGFPSSLPPMQSPSDLQSNDFTTTLHASLLAVLDERARHLDLMPLSGTPPTPSKFGTTGIPPYQDPSPVAQGGSNLPGTHPMATELHNGRSSAQAIYSHFGYPDEHNELMNGGQPIQSTTGISEPDPDVPSSSQSSLPIQRGRTERAPESPLNTIPESSQRPNLKRSRSKSPEPGSANQSQDQPNPNSSSQSPHKKPKTSHPTTQADPLLRDAPPDVVQTVPATPIPVTPPDMSPVPIICPPPDYAPAPAYNFSLSTSAQVGLKEREAKERLVRFLEREKDLRAAERLKNNGKTKANPPRSMLNAKAKAALRKGDDKFVWETVLGVGIERRKAAVDWLLNVIPKLEAESPTANATSPDISTDEPEPAAPRRMSNLHDQLTTSPSDLETRFLAVWLFLRYFYLNQDPSVADGGSSSSNSRRNYNRKKGKNKAKAMAEKQRKFDRAAWNAAVASLAISVKFQRDCLKPLMPVFLSEYAKVVPYEDMSPETFKTAERVVMSTCSYRPGGTPQPLMDNLWAALPSLRRLLNFEDGWGSAMREAWSCLFQALSQPDVLKYPVSVLTTVALMHGITDTLIKHIISSDAAQSRPSTRSRDETTRMTRTALKRQIEALNQQAEIRARERTKRVFSNMQTLAGVTDSQLTECRQWMSSFRLVY